MDGGRGVMIFGGSSHAPSDDNSGTQIFFDKSYFLKIGYNVARKGTANSGEEDAYFMNHAIVLPLNMNMCVVSL